MVIVHACTLQAAKLTQQDSELRPFLRANTTLKKWCRKLLNYWCYPVTSALVGGQAQPRQDAEKEAYGYRNDRSFLRRALSVIHTD